MTYRSTPAFAVGGVTIDMEIRARISYMRYTPCQHDFSHYGHDGYLQCRYCGKYELPPQIRFGTL